MMTAVGAELQVPRTQCRPGPDCRLGGAWKMDFDFDRALSRLNKQKIVGTQRVRDHSSFTSGPFTARERSKSDHRTPQMTQLEAIVLDCNLGNDESCESKDSSGACDQDSNPHTDENFVAKLHMQTPQKNSKSTYCRQVPSLQELCLQSLCDDGLQHCKSLYDIPDHLVIQVELLKNCPRL